MATDTEIRHYERDVLFRVLRAKKENKLEAFIAEFQAKMEQEDVKVVKQQLAEYYGEQIP